MSSKVMRITEEMVTAQDLRNRWTGVINTEFADGIDAACNRSSPEFPIDDIALPDFPTPFWLVKATEDELGKVTCHCLPCAPDFTNGESYEPKYSVRDIKGRSKYNFKKIVFLASEVSAFEAVHPEIFHEKVSIRKMENDDRDEDLHEELEKVNEQNRILREKNRKLKTELADLKARPLCDGKGALIAVCTKRRAHIPESEIAEFLKGSLSWAQVGVLLHDKPLCVSKDAISIHAKRLLGKA